VKPAFIVEGHSDARQIIGALAGLGDFRVIVTNGTKVNNALLFKIEDAIASGCEPYVLSDPDASGEQLYNMIRRYYPNMPRIEADFDECKYCKGWKNTIKWKAGIEYANYKYLRELLVEYLD
jgi:5S rRNA maturation endonuclease (ribonuclease M5)